MANEQPDWRFCMAYVENSKRVIGVYDAGNEKAMVIQVDGPYRWTLSFYRPYYLKVTCATHNLKSRKTEAAVILYNIFLELRNGRKLKEALKHDEWSTTTITDREISRRVSLSDFAASLDEIIESIDIRFFAE